MNKLIGIQTPHYAFNYGAQLQAFALGLAIKKMGFDIEYINRRPPTYYEFTSKYDKFVRRKELETKFLGFTEFEKLFLQPQSIRIIHNSEYENLDVTRYAAVVVGSDQIWRDSYFHSSFEYSPYLYFIDDPNVRKVSYAASFGKKTCVQPEDRRIEISRLLKQFYAISVREETGVNILNDYYDVAGKWVADPTLLHTADSYIKELKLTPKSVCNHQIVTYILGGTFRHFQKLNKISSKKRIPLKHIYNFYYHSKILKRFKLNRFMKVPSVLEWLDLILNSKYVITDSFHGLAFSIIFNKQFVVFNNSHGGSERFISLLSIVGLEDRMFEWESKEEDIIKKLCEEIDYTKVNSKLKMFIDSSKDFLLKSLL